MTKHMNTIATEGGNVVALTLLGLAVAILAGVGVLYFIGRSTPERPYAPIPDSAVQEEVASTTNVREGWRTYEDQTYSISFEYPEGWVVATGTLPTGEPALSIFQAVGTSTDTNQVLAPGDSVAHVSIYPMGVNGHAVFDGTKASTVIIEIPQAFAKDYVLAGNRPWATEAFFETRPESWNENGFVFARSLIEEESFRYYRGEQEIAEADFDPGQGDRSERDGFIDQNVRAMEEEILKSLRFVGVGEDVSLVEKIDPTALIERPTSGEVVASPLTVQGNLYSAWYFKNDVQLKLMTDSGETLTQVPLVSFDDWEGQESIPFEVSLIFSTPTATSGRIVIEKTYVGLEDEEVFIPVSFK